MVFWNFSEPELIPKGNTLKQNRPHGVMNVVKGFFASTSSGQICLASSELLKNTDGEQRALRKFCRRNLDFSLSKRNVLRHAIWLTPLNQ